MAATANTSSPSSKPSWIAGDFTPIQDELDPTNLVTNILKKASIEGDIAQAKKSEELLQSINVDSYKYNLMETATPSSIPPSTEAQTSKAPQAVKEPAIRGTAAGDLTLNFSCDLSCTMAETVTQVISQIKEAAQVEGVSSWLDAMGEAVKKLQQNAAQCASGHANAKMPGREYQYSSKPLRFTVGNDNDVFYIHRELLVRAPGLQKIHDKGTNLNGEMRALLEAYPGPFANVVHYLYTGSLPRYVQDCMDNSLLIPLYYIAVEFEIEELKDVLIGLFNIDQSFSSFMDLTRKIYLKMGNENVDDEPFRKFFKLNLVTTLKKALVGDFTQGWNGDSEILTILTNTAHQGGRLARDITQAFAVAQMASLRADLIRKEEAGDDFERFYADEDSGEDNCQRSGQDNKLSNTQPQQMKAQTSYVEDGAEENDNIGDGWAQNNDYDRITESNTAPAGVKFGDTIELPESVNAVSQERGQALGHALSTQTSGAHISWSNPSPATSLGYAPMASYSQAQLPTFFPPNTTVGNYPAAFGRLGAYPGHGQSASANNGVYPTPYGGW